MPIDLTIHRLHELPPELVSVLLCPNRPTDDQVDKARSVPLDAVNWESIAEEANAHVVGVLVFERLRDLGLADTLPESVLNSWEADRLHAKLQHILQRQDALRISRALSTRNIRHAFIKGFAYRDWLYDPAWSRIGGDADILIDRTNVELARQVLMEEKFIQAAYSPDHKHFRPASQEEIVRAESAHHELAEFTKDHILENPPEWLLSSDFSTRSPFAFGTSGGKPVLHSSIDIHWAIHFLFAAASPLDEITEFAIQDWSLPVLPVEWNIVISGFKLYFEAFDRPRYGFTHLVDLIGLLHSGMRIDWSKISRLAEQYRLDATLFYTLSAAQAISGTNGVPRNILDDWSKIEPTNHRECPAPLDFGDFVPYLLNRRMPTSFVRPFATGDHK